MQFQPKISLFPSLQMTINELIDQAALILPERKRFLQDLAHYIVQKKRRKETVKLNFICTHNSRRSHLAQIWAATAAACYNLEISTYSGGTEATALAPQMASALRRVGFSVSHSGGDNPTYRFLYAPDQQPIICFSKTYDDDANPVLNFAAIMTCTDADENCPYIPGADLRLSLPYEDPKRSDGTTEEGVAYDETVHQLGREIFHLMHLAKTGLNH